MHIGSTVRSEQRNTSRKILKVKALLHIEGAETVVGRTLDVGTDGVCLLLEFPLQPGSNGTVYFEIFHDGKAKPITARARVQYCILSNGEFKVGFQFVNVDLTGMAALSKFLH
jgi:hypothetical protein